MLMQVCAGVSQKKYRRHEANRANTSRVRHYGLGMEFTSQDEIPKYDCVLIVTDHSGYDGVPGLKCASG
jgi:hypothetical protein